MDNQGSILILSLWALSVLGLFTMSVGYNVRGKISLAERIDLRSQLHGLAEMGVQKVAVELKKEKTSSGFNTLNYSWANAEELFRSVPVGGGSFSVSYVFQDPLVGKERVQYGVQDEESRINLNTADAKVLSRLFQLAAGLEEEEADTLAYSIIDWRDSDTFMGHPEYGAEDDYYEELDMPYKSKNRPFDVVNEILLVRGMNPEIFEKLKDKITVYGTGGVNANTASQEVLSAIGLSQKAVDKILRYRGGQDGEILTPDDRTFSQPSALTAELSSVITLSSSEVAEISNLVSAGTLVTTSNYFLIRSRGELEHKKVVTDVVARIDREGKIVSWSTGLPRRIVIKSDQKKGVEAENLLPEVLSS